MRRKEIDQSQSKVDNAAAAAATITQLCIVANVDHFVEALAP
jgi:hypothetical protein